MNRVLIAFLAGVIALAGLGFLGWNWLTRNPSDLNLQELGQRAGQAYVYGFPLVLMDETRASMGHNYGFEINQLGHITALPNHTARTVVRPNRDTLYSIGWLDLSEGPVVLRWPDMGERYWLFQVLDGWTDVVGQPGSRADGSGPGAVMIAGPNWDGPALPDMGLIKVETEMAWILGRIAVAETQADLDAGRALQTQFSLTGGEGVEPLARPASEQRPPDTVMAMSPDQFFTRLADLMAANPARPQDADIVAALAEMGMTAGGYDSNSYGKLAKTAMKRGVEAAMTALSEGVLNREVGSHGWVVPSMSLGDYGTDYGLRAGVALIGLGANKPEDAIYPVALTDSQGRTLNGSYTYQMRFQAGQLPPADAFWSITSYDDEGWLMDVPRYNLGDRDQLVFEDDGALVITFGHQLPEGAPASNHLPVPEGQDFQPTARLYDPRAEALSGNWQMPALQRLD